VRHTALLALLTPLCLGAAPATPTAPPASAPASQPRPAPPPILDDAALEALIREAQAEPRLGKRVNLISRRFLHTPYAVSPLGEGPGSPPDEDPRFSVHAFDCTTFVETVVALALARDLAQARRILDAIRYQGGVVSFATRKHFPMAQWVPQNIEAGFFVDITRRVGGPTTRVAYKLLDLEVWERRRNKEILPELKSDQLPQGTAALPFIPIEEVVAHLGEIPDGTVITVVRENYKSVPIRVSHQGLLVRRGERLFMRHALQKGYNRVIDVPFERYVERIGKYGKWPVVGFNLLQPQTPPDLERIAGGASR